MENRCVQSEGVLLPRHHKNGIPVSCLSLIHISGLGEEVRERTDALDSLGNTTAATGKGFAIASAALTALALIASFIVQVKFIAPDFAFNLDITNPPVLVGLFLGGVLPFLFAAMTMSAVGRSAQSIVQEVRRQFREITGLMDGRACLLYTSVCRDFCGLRQKSLRRRIRALRKKAVWAVGSVRKAVPRTR